MVCYFCVKTANFFHPAAALFPPKNGTLAKMDKNKCPFLLLRRRLLKKRRFLRPDWNALISLF